MSFHRRWLLFALELMLGVAYVVAFGIFVTQSHDFVAIRENNRAMTTARLMQPVVPARFVFGPGSADNQLLGIGWWLGPLSADGQWSRTHAFAYLPISTDAPGRTLTVDGEAFVAPGHDSVEIVLSVNGDEAARWTARAGQPQPPVTVDVPAGAAEAGVLELRLDVDAPAVPEHFGFVDRTQEVGFLLRSVTLEAD